jgi:hypothetical protein
MTYAEIKINPTLADSAVEYVEQLFPKTATRFKELSGDGIFYRFFCTKQKDYGPENIRGGNDLTINHGRQMAIREIGRRMGDKVSRISNLTYKAIEARVWERVVEWAGNKSSLYATLDIEYLQNELKKCQPSNESLEDSLVDLSIYGTIAILVHEGLWGL